MKINSNFTVVANCVNLGLIDQTKEDKLTLLFDKEKALEFISRFNNNIIEVSSIVDGEEDNKIMDEEMEKLNQKIEIFFDKTINSINL